LIGFLLGGCGVKSNPVPPPGTQLPTYVDKFLEKSDTKNEEKNEEKKLERP
jgi:hypothetical protein